MSDLISRSKVISVLEQLEEHSLSGKMNISNAIYLLEMQPTAYDIDKVVKELEELKNKDICDYLDCDFCLYYKKCGVETDQSNNLKWDKAIEIVKHGGVSDDVCEWRLCDEEANVYDTSCRNPHILIEGTPKENNYEYCPYCGKKIKVVE